MRVKRYRRWQVLLGFVAYMLIMGFVGKVDCDSRQALLDEKINIREGAILHTRHARQNRS